MGASLKVDGCCKACRDDKTLTLEENFACENRKNYDTEHSNSISSVVRRNIESLKKESEGCYNDHAMHLSNDPSSPNTKHQLNSKSGASGVQKVKSKYGESSSKSSNKDIKAKQIKDQAQQTLMDSRFQRIYVRPSSPPDPNDIEQISRFSFYKQLISNSKKVLAQDKSKILMQGRYNKVTETGIRNLQSNKEVYLTVKLNSLELYKSKEKFLQLEKPHLIIEIYDIIKIRLGKQDMFGLDFITNRNLQTKESIELTPISKTDFPDIVSLIYFLINYSITLDKKEQESLIMVLSQRSEQYENLDSLKVANLNINELN